MKPIVSPEVEARVEDILAPFADPARWVSLGLAYAPVPSAVILLIGEPGTGKTTLAKHIARKLTKKKMPCVSFADVASDHLGGTEKAIVKVFDDAIASECPVLFMDEVDSLLWDRAKINEQSMHMLSIVDTMLLQLDRFIEQGGVVIMATNHPQQLDKALKRRITDTISLEIPTGATAIRAWKSKMPKIMTQTLTQSEFTDLSAFSMTPNDMEHAILSVCRKAFKVNVDPTFAMLLESLKQQTN